MEIQIDCSDNQLDTSQDEENETERKEYYALAHGKEESDTGIYR